jgi:hypothetical protein
MITLNEKYFELGIIAAAQGGELHEVGGPYIRFDTEDNTSKENYDDLLDIANDIKPSLATYEITDMWADHNTQIIEFKKIIKEK